MLAYPYHSAQLFVHFLADGRLGYVLTTMQRRYGMVERFAIVGKIVDNENGIFVSLASSRLDVS